MGGREGDGQRRAMVGEFAVTVMEEEGECGGADKEE